MRQFCGVDLQIASLCRGGVLDVPNAEDNLPLVVFEDDMQFRALNGRFWRACHSVADKTAAQSDVLSKTTHVYPRQLAASMREMAVFANGSRVVSIQTRMIRKIVLRIVELN